MSVVIGQPTYRVGRPTIFLPFSEGPGGGRQDQDKLYLTVLGSSVGRGSSSEAGDCGFKPRSRHTKFHYKNDTSSFPVCAQH